MPKRRPPPPHVATAASAGSAEVDALLAGLAHPFQAALEDLRRAIRSLDPRIGEAVKWKAPSFHLADHFATFKLHPPTQLQLVLHRGAKAPKAPRPFRLDAPAGLVTWAAPDRCVITLRDSAHAAALSATVVDLVRQWIAQLD